MYWATRTKFNMRFDRDGRRTLSRWPIKHETMKVIFVTIEVLVLCSYVLCTRHQVLAVLA